MNKKEKKNTSLRERKGNKHSIIFQVHREAGNSEKADSTLFVIVQKSLR